MLISSHLQALLSKFQAHYPMGSLCAELLTIHQGQYIVRSIVQSAGMTLATAMATASDIETAEDRAKTRVLETIGLTLPAAMPLPTPSLSPTSVDPSKSSWPDAKPNVTKSLHPLPLSSEAPQPNRSSFQQPTSVTDSSLTEIEQSQAASQAEAIDLNPISLPPLSSLASPPEENPSPTEVRDRLAFHAEGATMPHSTSATARSASSLGTSRLTDTASPVTESLTSITMESTVELPKDAPKPSAKPEKVSKRKESPEVQPTPTPSSSELGDRSEEIMKIGIEMKRLGWSMEQGREYLKRTYGKRSRQELDDAELLDFLHYLERQLSPVQTPF